MIQEEANTRPVADCLSQWVGPVVEFARAADLIVLAAQRGDGTLATHALSGPPPLVEAEALAEEIVLRFPKELLAAIPDGTTCGGIVINVAGARRSRISGQLVERGDFAELRCRTAFTNYRKYVAPSVALCARTHIGPTMRHPIHVAAPRTISILLRAELAFLATVSPAGVPDASHRGGPPGFLHLDPASGEVEWAEFVGDGMFVSAGNLRATKRFTLLVPDLDTGEALELLGEGDFQTLERHAQPRTAALLQGKQAYPEQGRVRGRVSGVALLDALCGPRERVPAQPRVNSCSPVEVQEPC